MRSTPKQLRQPGRGWSPSCALRSEFARRPERAAQPLTPQLAGGSSEDSLCARAIGAFGRASSSASVRLRVVNALALTSTSIGAPPAATSVVEKWMDSSPSLSESRRVQSSFCAPGATKLAAETPRMASRLTPNIAPAAGFASSMLPESVSMARKAGLLLHTFSAVSVVVHAANPGPPEPDALQLVSSAQHTFFYVKKIKYIYNILNINKIIINIITF